MRAVNKGKEYDGREFDAGLVYAKNPDMSILIGTTRKEHLQDSIDALTVELSAEDIVRMEDVFPAEMLQGRQMRNFLFQDGKIVRD
ncbi:MAG: hypothetical protein IJV50_11435 [Lachnospiraceae bacterium]|nr:hypothetical protein [Lachnospiraceae bacterium]